MLYDVLLVLGVVAVSSGVLTTIIGLSVSSLGLFVACVMTFSLFFRLKKREGDKLHCLTFPCFDIM